VKLNTAFGNTVGTEINVYLKFVCYINAVKKGFFYEAENPSCPLMKVAVPEN
jgi:hypothetical protein